MPAIVYSDVASDEVNRLRNSRRVFKWKFGNLPGFSDYSIIETNWWDWGETRSLWRIGKMTDLSQKITVYIVNYIDGYGSKKGSDRMRQSCIL